MAPQVKKTWTRLCGSKHLHPRAPPSRGTEGAAFSRNPDTQQFVVGGHCTHLATAGTAALEQIGKTTQFGWLDIPPDRAVAVAAAAIHYRSVAQSHQEYHELLQPAVM